MITDIKHWPDWGPNKQDASSHQEARDVWCGRCLQPWRKQLLNNTVGALPGGVPPESLSLFPPRVKRSVRNGPITTTWRLNFDSRHPTGNLPEAPPYPYRKITTQVLYQLGKRNVSKKEREREKQEEENDKKLQIRLIKFICLKEGLQIESLEVRESETRHVRWPTLGRKVGQQMLQRPFV